MSETVSELSGDIDYQGHKLRIDDFEPDGETPVRSFIVNCNEAHIECHEGFDYEDSSGRDVIEADILYVSYIHNSDQKGMGGMLMRFALEEGARRGFTKARMLIFNPRIISILQRIHAEGAVGPPIYFRDHKILRSLSTQELIGTIPRLSAEEATVYLASFKADENDYQDEGMIPCVVELNT